jgi:hypothetical protein
VCFPKGGDTVGTDGARVRKLLWDVYYEFDSAKLEQVPVPAETSLELPELLQRIADTRNRLLPSAENGHPPTRATLDQQQTEAKDCLARMIGLQEALDWRYYYVYGIVDSDLTLPADQVPSLELGERAFEIVLARAGDETEWFTRHKATPITDLPKHWPHPYRQLVERRIAVIESNREVALIERPEYKRRWNLPTWAEMESSALKNWLLDRIEANAIWKDRVLVSCAQCATP